MKMIGIFTNADHIWGGYDTPCECYPRDLASLPIHIAYGQSRTLLVNDIHWVWASFANAYSTWGGWGIPCECCALCLGIICQQPPYIWWVRVPCV